VVLFGGLGEVVNPLSDTWEWDGQSWQQRWPVAVPALRAAASLAPDPATGALMLFGGQQGQAVLNDTWSWDGLNWRAWSPGAPPPARSGAAMADYPLPGRMTLYGGWSGAGTLGDTWQWDGSSWSPALPSPTAPSARSGAALASRGTVRSMCLFGGSEPLQVAPHGDTWELDDGGCAPGGWGQPAGGLPCGCETEPRVGTSFCASFSFPPPQGSGQGLMLGAPGACLGVPFTILPPGVCGPTLLRLLPAFAVLVTGDPLRFCATLPSSPALIGQAFCLQGAAVEVGACLRATDAVQVVVYR
jgi:hypothetical protein